MKRDRGEDGISEVVGFVVILAVVVAGLSVYLTYAVPVQGREEEIKVMDGVRTWFVDYKTGVDQLWLNSPGVEEGELFKATIGRVKLRKVIDPGTAREKGFIGRYLPLLAPIPCSGEVSIRKDGHLTIVAKADHNQVTIPIYDDVDDGITTLVYTSHNYYWFQQEYSYQHGGVFLRQWDMEDEKVTLVAAPPLSIYELPGNQGRETRVEIVVTNLDATGGGIGATSPVRVETCLKETPACPVDDAAFSEVTLTFEATSVETARAWKDAFTGAATRNGLGDRCVATVTEATKTASITIQGPPPDPVDPDPGTNDVVLEVLDARYSMSLENVPTMIE